MDKFQLEELYKRVQNKDREAEDQLIALHREQFPTGYMNKVVRGRDPDYRTFLGIMYRQLHRKLGG